LSQKTNTSKNGISKFVKSKYVYKKNQIEQRDNSVSLIEEYHFVGKVDKWQELMMLD